MNPNDRQKAVALGVLIGVVAVGVIGYVFFYLPFAEAGDNIERLAKEVETKRLQIAAFNKDKKKLERWRLLSLPGEVTAPVKAGPGGAVQDKENQYYDLEDKYKKYLNDLLNKHKIVGDYPQRSRNEAKVVGGSQQQQGAPPYVTLVFKVDNIKTKLPNLVAWMIDFQNTPLLQRIKKLSIRKDDKTDYLKVDLTIEAIIVQGATKRPKTMLGVDERLVALDVIAALRRAPAGLTLVPWAVGPTGPKALPALKEKASTRDYAAISKKNIFLGMVPYSITDPGGKNAKEKTKEQIAKELEEEEARKLKNQIPQPVKDVLRFARLTDISGDVKQLEANLWNPLTQRVIRLREQKGYDRFPLLLNSNDSTVVYGQVARFDGTRGLIFRIQLAALEPGKSATNPYPAPNAFYRPTKSDLEKLIETKKVKAEEADRVFKVSLKYWNTLLRDKVMVRKGYGKGPLGDFVSSKELLRGKVVEADDKYVVIRLEERSSAYRDDAQDLMVRPHLGFCMLTGRLSDALQSPVADHVARQLLGTVEAVGTVEPDSEEDP